MTTQEYAEKAAWIEGVEDGLWLVSMSFLDRERSTDMPSSARVDLIAFTARRHAEEFRVRVVHVLEHFVRFALGSYEQGLLEPKPFPELLEALKKATEKKKG